jgi:YidC/Oxa1 family membrane protein insertase
MDRTSRIGVFVCLALLVYIWLFLGPTPPKVRPVPLHPAPALTTPATATSPTTASALTPAAAPSAQLPEQVTILENDQIKATFTSRGAAVKEVELKNHLEGEHEQVVLNEQAHSNILQLGGWPGADSVSFAVQQSPGALVYTGTLPDGLVWVRTYTMGKDYALSVQDTLSNSGAADIALPGYNLSVGRAEPLRNATSVSKYLRNSNLMYVGCGWFTNKSFHLTTINNFNPSYIPLVGIKTGNERDVFSSTTVDPLPVRWLGAENQFFTVLLTPSSDHLIDHAQFQCFNERDANGNLVPNTDPDIEATAFFPGVNVPARQSISFQYSLYAGPKDYDRLNALGEQQGELMNYNGFLPFAYLIVPMLWVLRFFHHFVGNYGIAIILLTLCIKGITWPLQSFANRSGKRMQALAPKIKELQAKYKEQPEKLNTETFALYREYGVNPFGGCVPALVQMPVFFSLYYMLQNAVELRGQKFLWVHDLTQPDTIATLTLAGHHLALNPLPLMVTGLTVVMMRMTPQIGDPQQAKIAQFMPLIFLFIFYNFAAALSLYYVINNCVSIVQIYRNLRKPLPELKRVPKKKTA